MITGKDIYDVFAAIVPLYVAMILAYGSVRWWKIFTPDQCSGINRFVAVFAVPLLSFHFISTNNIYAMNFHFIAADSLQKVVVLGGLFLWQALSKKGNLEWMITLFSLSTLPNTLVMGIPLLKAMYGDFSGSLMVQIVVLQSVIWYTLMLFLFEYRGAKLLISDQFPETAASITSFRVESDVVSLNGREPLQADAEIGDDGKLHVVVRRSTATSSVVSSSTYGHHHHRNNNNKLGLNSVTSMTPRASNLTGVEIYSIQSSREPTPRASSFNQTDFYAMFASKVASPTRPPAGGGGGDIFSLQSSKGVTPRTSNFEEEIAKQAAGNKRGRHNNAQFGRSMSGELFNISNTTTSSNNNNNNISNTNGNGNGNGNISYPPPNPLFMGQGGGGKMISRNNNETSSTTTPPNKDLHMFVWSSSASPVSEHMKNNAAAAATTIKGSAGGATDPQQFGVVDSSKAVLQREINAARMHEFGGNTSPLRKTAESDHSKFPVPPPASSAGAPASPYLTSSCQKNIQVMDDQDMMNVVDHMGADQRKHQMPPASVMTRLILIMVWRKLIRNPNTYSSLLGLIWSLVSYRWNIQMPTIVRGSISILSDAGLGMAMFSLGLFMALQPRIIACGNRVATFAMLVRFLTGPGVMAATSIAIGIRGVLLHVAIVQAALPQGIVPFVFAKEYNVHPDILSTGVIFGMLIALPITILYYVLLGV